MVELEKMLKAFVGQSGISLLQKAFAAAGKGTELSNYSESLQILPRAVLSWAHNVAKNASANLQKHAIPNTEYILAIKKNNNKFDFEILQKTQTVITQSSVELPSLVLELFK